MKLEVFGTVVNSVLDNNPYIVISIMLVDLVHGDKSVSLLGWFSGRGIIGSISINFKKTSESGRVRLSSSGSHPSSSLLSRLSGVLKSKDVLSRRSLVQVNLNAEALVISHSHQVPGWVHGLTVIGLIPGTAHDFLASYQIGNLELETPPGPAPVHTVVVGLLLTVEVYKLPVDSSICGYLNTRDHTSTSSVSVSSYLVVLSYVLGN
mmetsp:Transcript_9986/g.15061  ORF Transcript_9986/g.15061 Transcript_9986/m.15061 type:complete len:207 (-) Transcript_9986:1044-1664(-)